MLSRRAQRCSRFFTRRGEITILTRSSNCTTDNSRQRSESQQSREEKAETGFLEGAYGIQVVDAGELPHGYTATSTLRISTSCGGSTATARYARMASRILSRASVSVKPCDQQPGRPGTKTLYPPRMLEAQCGRSSFLPSCLDYTPCPLDRLD